MTNFQKPWRIFRNRGEFSETVANFQKSWRKFRIAQGISEKLRECSAFSDETVFFQAKSAFAGRILKISESPEGRRAVWVRVGEGPGAIVFCVCGFFFFGFFCFFCVFLFFFCFFLFEKKGDAHTAPTPVPKGARSEGSSPHKALHERNAGHTATDLKGGATQGRAEALRRPRSPKRERQYLEPVCKRS